MVVRSDGSSEPLSRFLTRVLKGGGLSVSEVSRRSGLSRSYLYVLMDDEQTPTTESLVTLLAAAGCEDVRPADPWEEGDLAFRWQGDDLWVRYPDTSKRSTRSRNTMRSLSRGADAWSAPPSPMPISAAAAASYDMTDAGSRSPAGDRQLLLGQLLEAASDLDEARLRLLVEHARLLRRG